MLHLKDFLLSWNEEICFQRPTFSTNITSERVVTFMKLENMSLKGYHFPQKLHLKDFLLSWNEKICFPRLTFSTYVTSERFVTSMKLKICLKKANIFHKCYIWNAFLLLSWNWKMCLQEANIFNKCCIWRTCYFHEIRKCVFTD